MSAPAYMMITVASCSPDFLTDALAHTGSLAEELKSDAGAISTRVGVMATGNETGSLFLLQTYSELNGIEGALSVYNTSDHYKALIGSGKIAVTLRNIVKIEDVGLANPDMGRPAYGVVTRMGTQGLMLDEARALVPNFENNGAMILRYGTLITGSAAGRRLLAVAYPSMDAIEKVYESLRGDPKYAAFLSKAEIDFRNIIRITA
ncbi:MAG: hypothetical protein LJE68_11870 [Rhodobacter sp.]|nr:hypothetical protein [Rhodobacter sp.]